MVMNPQSSSRCLSQGSSSTMSMARETHFKKERSFTARPRRGWTSVTGTGMRCDRSSLATYLLLALGHRLPAMPGSQ